MHTVHVPPPSKYIYSYIISHGNIPGILEIEMDELLVMKRTNFTWAVYLKAARQVIRQKCEEICNRRKIQEADRRNKEKNANNTTIW